MLQLFKIKEYYGIPISTELILKFSTSSVQLVHFPHFKMFQTYRPTSKSNCHRPTLNPFKCQSKLLFLVHIMDVENSNRSDVRCRRPLKRLPYIVNNNIFSMETYFVWFSALIFLTELVTGKLTPRNESISWPTIFCLHLRTCAERLTC